MKTMFVLSVCAFVRVLGDCHTHTQRKRIVLCHYLPWPYAEKKSRRETPKKETA